MGLRVAEELLASAPEIELMAIDVSENSLAKFQSALGNARVKTSIANAEDTPSLAKAMKGSKVIINAAQYDINRLVMQAALLAGAHYVDLGGMFHETRRQLKLNDEFKKTRLTAIPGMGAAPGLTNLLAAQLSDNFVTLESVSASFGASVENHPGPSQFVPPYSLRTIMQEFMEESVQFVDGKHQTQAPMSGARLIEFPNPIGELECIYTLHSEPATLPDFLHEKGIRNVTWHLGLPIELTNAIRAFAAAGLSEEKPIEYQGQKIIPIDFLIASIEANKQKSSPEKAPYTESGCLRLEVSGTVDSGEIQTRVATCQRSITGVMPDMAGVITGVPCAIAALMLAKEQIKMPGVYAPEYLIDPGAMFEALKARGFKFTSEITTTN